MMRKVLFKNVMFLALCRFSTPCYNGKFISNSNKSTRNIIARLILMRYAHFAVINRV